jgi:RNA polymerase sigma-70 factor (ECF subfamily)
MQTLRAIDYAALPEAALAAQARTADPDAFREIMRRCNQRLFRVARSLVHEDAEAEDVLQEAYACAFAHIAEFRGEAALATWLTRIVLNEARGRLRRQRPHLDLDQVDVAQGRGQVLPFPARPDGADPEADAGRAEIRRLLEHAIDDLPTPFRLVFILREIQELSVEETAADLGIRPETVKTRLHRARRLLRQALDEKLAGVLVGAYPFLGARCERITETVLARMASPAA